MQKALDDIPCRVAALLPQSENRDLPNLAMATLANHGAQGLAAFLSDQTRQQGFSHRLSSAEQILKIVQEWGSGQPEFSHQSWVTIHLAAPRIDGIGLVLAVSDSRLAADELQKRGLLLQVRLNATAAAELLADARTMSEVRQTTVDYKSINLERRVSGLLDLAARVSESEDISLVILDGSTGQLRSVVSTSPQSTGLTFGSPDETNSMNIVVLAFNSYRPFFGRRNLEAEVFSRETMALPIPSGLPSSGYPNEGVLLIRAKNQVPITTASLSWLRNLTLRLALEMLKARMDAGIAVTLEQLPHFTSVSLTGAVPTAPRRTDERAQRNGISADIERALGTIETLLQTIYDITRSRSATFRVVKRDRRSQTGKDQLLRLIGIPQNAMGTPFVIDPSANNSVVAWVARAGEECYIEDVRHPAAFRDYPGLSGHIEHEERRTRSEYCLPVVVDGLVVATVNLESPVRAAYTGRQRIVRLLCQTIAQAVAYQRHAAVATVSVFAQQLQHSHVAAKLERARQELEGIRLRANVAGDGLSRSVGEVSDLLETSPTRDEEITIDDLIRRELAKLDLVADLDVATSFMLPVPDGRVDPYAAMFREICENLVNHTDHQAIASRRARILVSVRRTRRRRSPYCMVLVSAPCRETPDPDVVRTAYRTPVWSDPALTPGMGSYVAGSIARSLGGDIDMTTFVQGSILHISTRLLLPM